MPDSAAPAIEAKKLVKVYASARGDIRALDGIEFQVRQGEIFGLIGADGAGKTTAFQILSGVMEPTQGEVLVLQRPPRDSRDEVGYLTQRFSLYPDLSVDENLHYSAGLRQVPEERLRIRGDRFLALFGLAPFRDRLAGRLSGGMKQKLALSCALVSSPRVLLLDEPTTGVDPVSRRDFWDALASLAGEGMTIVVATPYLDEAERCHRVALMERGRIVDIDAPSRFRSKDAWTRLEIVSPNLGAASEVLTARLESGQGKLVDVQRFGDRLDVIVTSRDEGEREVKSVAARAGLPMETAAATGPTLENALVASLRRLRGLERHPPFPGRRADGGRPGELLLEARGLHKRFGHFDAVKDFQLSLRRGEIYGLLGANGAGKTTAIKMMCGLLAPTKGQVTLLGRRKALRSAELRRRIGYMSQKFTLYDDLSIGQNLDFYASIYGVPDKVRRRRKEWVLEVSELEGQEKLVTGALPGGWKQRVAFGAAIMHEPDLIFLDEPTSGVDPLARRAMWRMINELADAGAALLVVTHYLEEAEQCGRIGFMAAGEMLLEGSPGEVRARMEGGLISIECDQPGRAYVLLKERYGPARLSMFGDRIHLRTVEPGSAIVEAGNLLAQSGIATRQAREIRHSLEDVFIALMEERRIENSAKG